MPKIPIARGDIVYLDFQGAVGGEKQNDVTVRSRPCVIVQNDGGNGRSPLTIVAPLTDEAQYAAVLPRIDAALKASLGLQ